MAVNPVSVEHLAFEELLKDSTLSIASDLSRPGEPLLIAFGGRAGAMGILPFEFFRVTQELDVNKVFLRDLNQIWYQAGLKGHTTGIDDTAELLRQTIESISPSRVIVVGNSMGGYAALLFGILLAADSVHAFVPKSLLNAPEYLHNKESYLELNDHYPDTYFDIKQIMLDHIGVASKTELHVYFDPANAMDKKHADYLGSLRQISLHRVRAGGSHAVVKELNQTDRLKNIIRTALLNEDVPRPSLRARFNRLFRNSPPGNEGR